MTIQDLHKHIQPAQAQDCDRMLYPLEFEKLILDYTGLEMNSDLRAQLEEIGFVLHNIGNDLMYLIKYSPFLDFNTHLQLPNE